MSAQTSNARAATAVEEEKRPILLYLESALTSLTPVERRIAQHILSDPERIITASINEVVKGAGVSVGSVIGFCKSLNLNGFSQFKIALAQELAQSALVADEDVAGESVFKDTFLFHQKSLDQTLKLNSEVVIRDICKALSKAKRIEFIAIGMSQPVAYFAACKLSLIGFPAFSNADPHMQLIRCSQLSRSDLAFAISCSGTTPEVVQALSIAKEQGAKTVSLTNAMGSSLALMSDHCLYASPSEIRYFQAPLASRVTQLALIDVIFTSLARINQKSTAVLLQRSAEALAHRGRLVS